MVSHAWLGKDGIFINYATKTGVYVVGQFNFMINGESPNKFTLYATHQEGQWTPKEVCYMQDEDGDKHYLPVEVFKEEIMQEILAKGFISNLDFLTNKNAELAKQLNNEQISHEEFDHWLREVYIPQYGEPVFM